MARAQGAGLLSAVRTLVKQVLESRLPSPSFLAVSRKNPSFPQRLSHHQNLPNLKQFYTTSLTSTIPFKKNINLLPFAGLLFALSYERTTNPPTADSPTTLTKSEEQEFLQCVEKDTHVAVEGLFALPLLSLTVGYEPHQELLEQGSELIEKEICILEPWELSVILWGWARLGFNPHSALVQQIQNLVLERCGDYTLEDLTATLWSLCVLDAMTDDVWNCMLGRIKDFSVRDFDEASALHLVQAGMLYSSSQTNVRSKLGQEIRTSKQEIEGVLSGLPWRLTQFCLQKYQEYIPFHPYLEGPYMTLTYMMQKLHCFKAKGVSAVYDNYFKNISKGDLDKAKRTLSDTRKLSQIKRELFYQWRGNEIVDTWQQCVNEVVFLLSRRLGNTVLQPPDCDVVLPQKRVVVFVEDDLPREPIYSLQEASEGMLQLFGTETATPTSGFALHESKGTKMAKRRALEQRGWRVVVIPLSAWQTLKDPESKQKFLQEIINSRGVGEGMGSILRSALNR